MFAHIIYISIVFKNSNVIFLKLVFFVSLVFCVCVGWLFEVRGIGLFYDPHAFSFSFAKEKMETKTKQEKRTVYIVLCYTAEKKGFDGVVYTGQWLLYNTMYSTFNESCFATLGSYFFFLFSFCYVHASYISCCYAYTCALSQRVVYYNACVCSVPTIHHCPVTPQQTNSGRPPHSPIRAHWLFWE